MLPRRQRSHVDWQRSPRTDRRVSGLSSPMQRSLVNPSGVGNWVSIIAFYVTQRYCDTWLYNKISVTVLLSLRNIKTQVTLNVLIAPSNKGAIRHLETESFKPNVVYFYPWETFWDRLHWMFKLSHLTKELSDCWKLNYLNVAVDEGNINKKNQSLTPSVGPNPPHCWTSISESGSQSCHSSVGGSIE